MAQETSTSQQPILKRNKGKSPIQEYYFESDPSVCLNSMQVKALLDVASTIKFGPGTEEEKTEFLSRHISETIKGNSEKKIKGFSEKFLEVAASNGYGTEEKTDIPALIDALRAKKKETVKPIGIRNEEALASILANINDPEMKDPEARLEHLKRAIELFGDKAVIYLESNAKGMRGGKDEKTSGKLRLRVASEAEPEPDQQSEEAPEEVESAE